MTIPVPTTPGRLDLTIFQGCAFSRVLAWKTDADPRVPIVLTGVTGVAKVMTADDTLIVSMTVTIDGAAGTIGLSLTVAQTLALQVRAGLLWDLVLTEGGVALAPLLAGRVAVREVQSA